MKLLALVGFALCSASFLHAQDQDVTFPPPQSGVMFPEAAPVPVVTPDIPIPPRSLQNRESSHPHPGLPVGPANGVPQPNDPPTGESDPNQPQPAAGAFVYFQNTLVNPTNLSRSPRTPEPATAVLRDTVLQTGNWHAAISPDNGETWVNVNPSTFFPAADGGFCCDQQAIDVQTHDIAVWMLQYSQGTNGNNRVRFGIANSRDELRSASPVGWTTYSFTAQTFGYAAGMWLDYEDIAFDSTWLYCRTNVIGAGESVVFRLNLNNLRDGVGVAYEFYTSGTIGGWSHRLAKGSGSAGVMAFAALVNTSSIDVWTWPSAASSAATRSRRSIGSFTTATVSVPGPDGRDWAGFWNATGQIQGAYGNATECGFSWGCAPQSGRAVPYTRVARFQLSNRALISEHDIWSSTLAFLYNDMMTNSVGDVGGTLAVGSSTSYVHTSNYIIDSYDPWPPATVFSQASGSSGPNTNRFGDYFTVRRHPVSTTTWVSNGSSCPDPNTGNHRYVWFGRDDNTPTWVNMNAQTSPVTGVTITQDVEDLDGRSGGASNYARRFAPRQGYQLTAPLTFLSGRTTYAFDHWELQVQPGASFGVYPVGDRTLDVSDCGNLDDTAIAYYSVRRTLTVNSVNPASGISVTVTPTDINGSGSGTTGFTRYYRTGDGVTLTAPSTSASGAFRYWTVDGTPQAAGVTSLNLSMSLSHTVEAVYWAHLVGSWTSIGAGCVGGNGLVPAQSIIQLGGGYVQGVAMTYRATNAAPNQLGVIHFGLSTTNWGAFSLPLNLNFIGMTGCTLFHDVVVSENVATNASGTANYVINWPVNPAGVGVNIYSTFAIIDPTAPRSLPLTHSNAVRLTIGGDH